MTKWKDVYYKGVPFLSDEEKHKIRSHLRKKGIIGEDLENAMNSKLCDLEEVLPVKKIMDRRERQMKRQQGGRDIGD